MEVNGNEGKIVGLLNNRKNMTEQGIVVSTLFGQ